MPKLKTHKGAKDRFQVSGAGKILRTKGGKSHLRRNRSKRAKRQYDEMIAASPHNRKKIEKLLPYMK